MTGKDLELDPSALRDDLDCPYLTCWERGGARVGYLAVIRTGLSKTTIFQEGISSNAILR